MIIGQVLKFMVVGGLSTLVNYTIFLLSYHYGHIHYVIASALGYVLGLAFGYGLNTAWTFQQQSGQQLVSSQTLRYIVVYAASLVISLGLVYLLVHGLAIDPRLANVIAIGQSTLTNFLGCKYYVFK